MKKVTGIGGIFFKCKDVAVTKKWYEKHLGLPVDDYGCTFWQADSVKLDEKASNGVRLKQSLLILSPENKSL